MHGYKFGQGFSSNPGGSEDLNFFSWGLLLPRGSEALGEKIQGAPTQGGPKRLKLFPGDPCGGGGSHLTHPQEVSTPGEGRVGGLQPPPDFQSVCESEDPLQKIPWQFVQQVRTPRHTRHRSRKVQRFKELMRELRELRKLRRAIRGGREFPCREFRHQGPWLQDEPLEVPPGLNGGPDSLQTQDRGVIMSPSLEGGLDISVSSTFFPLVCGVTTRGGVSTGEDPAPPALTGKSVQYARPREERASGGEGTKPHLAPKAPNPEGRKTVVWAENLENVVGEGAGCGSDDSDDDDIAELTTPAPKEGVEGGRSRGTPWYLT